MGQPVSRCLVLCLAGVLSAASTGCYANHPFPIAEIANLDGYAVYNEYEEIHFEGAYWAPSPYAPVYGPPYHTTRVVTDKPYRVVSIAGEQMLFSSEIPLILHLKDGRMFRSKYRSIEVKDGRFTGITMEGGKRVSVPTSALAAVALRRPDTGATLLVTLGVVGGTLLLLSVAVIAAGS